jgi:hypothetical protein
MVGTLKLDHSICTNLCFSTFCSFNVLKSGHHHRKTWSLKPTLGPTQCVCDENWSILKTVSRNSVMIKNKINF